MTVLNLISILALAALVTAGALAVRRARRALRDADGLGDVFEEGELDDGDLIGSVGESPSTESRRQYR